MEAFPQGRIARDFKPACDSLSTLIYERCGVEGCLRLKSVMKRGSTLDFYFTESLGDYPWRPDDIKWFRSTLEKLFPDQYSSYRMGEIYSRSDKFGSLAVDAIGFSGSPASSRNRIKAPQASLFVEKASGQKFSKGLDGRNIALWASHGRYYDQSQQRWLWQRPCLFQTVEDLYTSSYMLPFIVPMLENAGAYVMMPRERDTNPVELVMDNDPSYVDNGAPGYRGAGRYSESGSWTDAGKGFADAKETYMGCENPFSMGTARKAECISGNDGSISVAKWEPEFPARAEYAVYVSYKSFPNSTESARYTVNHLGGNTTFIVNQKIGGGTWIYLGTFEFDKGCSVTLDNVCPEERKFVKGSTVSADAVKFGGGTGNIARYRKGCDPSVAETSGLPRYAEAARYWLQWAGIDSTIFSQHGMKDDYRDDLFSRGDWVDYISGGSHMNPKRKGLGIPVDLAMALHSDAGIAQKDTIIGTLAIFSGRSNNIRTLPGGEPMMTSREFADIVQSQIVHDLKGMVDSTWTRRQIWDRGYRESRTPPAPTVLIESLSHQNFADMRFGLDPGFRFIFSRAVYKGMLKYLSNRYGCQYAVQPLPVNSFAAIIRDGGKVELSWKETADPLEPTASAKGYILYTRVDGRGFDDGKTVSGTYSKDGKVCASVDIDPGHIYSFRIAAYNDGGKSFQSETLSAGIPASRWKSRADSVVLVVNNFTRTAPPAWIDIEGYAGFDNSHDRGVPYMDEISFIGDMYEKRRESVWTSNENPGFGASYSDKAGVTFVGNTFDYTSVHGASILEAGYPFCSASADAFSSDKSMDEAAWAVDLICGKQVTTPYGSASGRQRYTVFTQELQNAVRRFTGKGKNVLVSGEYIGTDIWDRIYPVEKDCRFMDSSMEFAEKVLGFRWSTDYASRNCTVRSIADKDFMFPARTVSYNREAENAVYPVETPDGIVPSSSGGKTIFRYSDTGISAGVRFISPSGYRTVSIGFPIETVIDSRERNAIIETTLKFFSK
ncbi:MAG: xanthan lyase [Bacteroidales bacterium]|nr:xanthan lyase [Bacteroidales bacterium]